jgi:hypothetical protein
MIHLAAIPVFLIAYLLREIGKTYKFKTLTFIAKVLLIVSVLFFVYTFLAYNGIDLVDIVRDFIVEKF